MRSNEGEGEKKNKPKNSVEVAAVIQEANSSTSHPAAGNRHPMGQESSISKNALRPSWSIPLCHIPHSRASPAFAASSSPFPGTTTAHASCSGSATVGFSCCSQRCLLPEQSFIPSSSILLLMTTTQQPFSPMQLPCRCFFSLCFFAPPSIPLPHHV